MSARGKEKNKHLLGEGHREFYLCCYPLWLIVFITVAFIFVGGGLSFREAAAHTPEKELSFWPGKIERISLDNGLVVLVKENHHLPLVSIFLCVGVGSAREERLTGSGISHFVEHMVFKGTSTRKVGEVFKEIESWGGKINASTSYDYTAYRIVVPSEFVRPALEILADIVMHARFAEQELKKERQVVLKEIRLNYDDPQRYATRLLWQTAYSRHPYRYPILGEEDFFSRLTRKDLLRFYHSKYVPNNMVLAIVGDIQRENILSFIKELFKEFPPGALSESTPKVEPEQLELRTYSEEFTAGLTYLFFGFHNVAITDEDLYALDILAAVLGEGESSRLNKSLGQKKELVYNIEAVNYTPREPGLFIISCLLDKRYRRRVESLVLKEIRLVSQKEISPEELERAKNKLIGDILFYNQTLEAQAQDIALNEMLTGDFRFTERYIRKIREVSVQDVLEVARKYLHKNNLSIIALVPRKDLAGEAKSDLPAFSLKKRGGHGVKHPGREFLQVSAQAQLTKTGVVREQFSPPVKKYILDNGLTLLIKEKKDLPLVCIKAVFTGGLRAEDEATNGLSNLVAQMLDKGTRDRDASEIAYLVESKGARLSSFSGHNSFGLTLELLSRDFDQMLALFADLIINPTFPYRELRRQKEKNLAKLRTYEDDIFNSGTKMLKETLFTEHPYRFLTLGNEKSLRRLKRSDLWNFYRNFCVGKNAVLAIFGDIDEEEVLVKVKKYFSQLPEGSRPDIAPQKEPEIKTVRSSFKALPKQQSLVLFGFYGSTVLEEERYVLEIICSVLSQSSGRLFTQIREKIGLAYTLGAYQICGLDPGYIVIYVATTAEFIPKVKEEILHQLQLLKSELLTEEELAQAKRAIIGARLINRQSNSAQAMESALDELYGLGFNHYRRFVEQINRVKLEDVQRCARKYFDLTNYAVIVLGPANPQSEKR